MKFAYTHYFHAHGMPFYTPAMCGAGRSRTTHTSQCIYFLCAVLALGSAMCNMKNSMFVTPVNACIARAIIVCRGWYYV